MKCSRKNFTLIDLNIKMMEIDELLDAYVRYMELLDLIFPESDRIIYQMRKESIMKDIN